MKLFNKDLLQRPDKFVELLNAKFEQLDNTIVSLMAENAELKAKKKAPAKKKAK